MGGRPRWTLSTSASSVGSSGRALGMFANSPRPSAFARSTDVLLILLITKAADDSRILALAARNMSRQLFVFLRADFLPALHVEERVSRLDDSLRLSSLARPMILGEDCHTNAKEQPRRGLQPSYAALRTLHSPSRFSAEPRRVALSRP